VFLGTGFTESEQELFQNLDLLISQKFDFMAKKGKDIKICSDIKICA